MLIAPSELRPDATRQLARLHREALPTSVLGRLGEATLRRYYQWVARSPEEWLFVRAAGSEVDAAAVVSFGPASVIRRFVRQHLVSFGAAAAAAAIGNSAFRHEAIAYLSERTAEADGNRAPELLQIFVALDRRRQSHGTAIVNDVEASLAARGVGAYWVRTLRDGNPTTLAFYEGRGFEADGEVRFCGQTYVQLKKLIPGTGRLS
jgi:GNAT superfamily N-acetyltransferase